MLTPAVLLQDLVDILPAGAIHEAAVNENDIQRIASCHDDLLLSPSDNLCLVSADRFYTVSISAFFAW
jgi:hypothetical protein